MTTNRPRHQTAPPSNGKTRYLYYPGCSLKSTGNPYEVSCLAVFEALQIPLEELEDWNCCGATAYMGIDAQKAFALAARNLALAERQAAAWDSDSSEVNLVAPCNACYLSLVKVQKHMAAFPDIRERIERGFRAVGLEYQGRVRVRHPLDVLLNDIGLEAIAGRVSTPLSALRVACYYGCQMVRPYATFDDANNPTTMDRLLQSLGATTIDWPLKTRCCGGSLTGTIAPVGLRLNYILLKEAERRGANVLATACPLCQFNLECYQGEICREHRDFFEMPVVYFTQLTGLALGLSAAQTALNRLFVPLKPPYCREEEVSRASA